MSLLKPQTCCGIICTSTTFFTSHKLVKDLAEKQVKTTGTIRENRTGGAAKLMPATEAMKKTPRGSFDYRSDGDVYCCKWNNSRVVNTASNQQTHEPLHDARRRVKGASNTLVKQPHLIRRYNVGMGGVDLLDHLLAAY